MSNLIQSVDNDVIVLVDGTRIEINMSYDEYGNGNPSGFVVTEVAQQSVQRTGQEADPEKMFPDLTDDERHMIENGEFMNVLRGRMDD